MQNNLINKSCLLTAMKISATKDGDTHINKSSSGLFLGVVFVLLLIGILALSLWVSELSKASNNINSNNLSIILKPIIFQSMVRTFFDVLELKTDMMARDQLNMSISFTKMDSRLQKSDQSQVQRSKPSSTSQTVSTDRLETNLNGSYCVHFVSLIHNDSVKGIFQPIEHSKT